MAIRQILKSETFDFTTILSFIMGYINSILAIYASISLGQFVRDHRVIASIAFYAAIYTAQQIVSLVVLIPVRMLTIISLIISVVFSVIFYVISERILDRKLNLP